MTQPTKFAAMESLWETKQGADYFLLLLPDAENERNSIEAIGIPNFLSLLAFHDSNAKVIGLKEFPKEERPPVATTFFSFRIMVGLGFLFVLLSLIGTIVSRNDALENSTLFLKIMLIAIPLPYLATQLGWLVAEIGRQPWIVYGVLKTSDAVSNSVTTAQVIASLAGFTLVYGFLAVVGIYLLTKFAKKGPDDLSVILTVSSNREV